MGLDVSRRNLFAAAGAGGAALLLPATARASITPPPVLPFAPKPGTALLARNENPYGPGPAALKAIAEAASSGCYYAHGGEAKLKAMIAERNGLTPEHIMIGAGSAEVLNCAVIALGAASTGAGGHVLAADLTFDAPVKWAEEKGIAVKRVAMTPGLEVDLAAMAKAVGPDTKLIHLCNPNNPTGRLLSPAAVRAFAAQVMPKATLLLDEAYNELTDDPTANTLVDRVRAGDNLIVARTFSKVYGLAGMRVGYAMGRPDLIARMEPWGMSFGGNTAGIAAAIASYTDEDFIRSSRERIFEARGMIEAAAKKAGLETLPSAGNFVFVKVADAETVRKGMEAKNILIRGAYGPQWTNWSRVSCGKIDDVKRYAAVLPEVVRA